MKILTIIVTYNGKHWMDLCLGSLRKSSVRSDVIVIDNGSTDGTPEYIAMHFPEVQVVATGENFGFGKANNIGLKKAVDEDYDYVYLLNQDAWVFTQTFERLISAMETDPQYGILSPMQLTATEDKMDHRFMRWCPAAAWEEWCAGSFAGNHSESMQGAVHDVKFVMAAHWMISSKCLRSVGGFSPAFYHYGEDDNYIHRAKYHGFKCGVLSSAGAVHDREMRPTPKEARMRLKCVGAVAKVSNPKNCFLFRCFFEPLRLLTIAIRYNSMTVLKYIPKLIGSYGRLKAIRAQSVLPGAFL